jgi:hypothetical protein
MVIFGKKQKFNFDWLLAIIFYLFLFEMIVGCNGHWLEFDILGLTLTPRILFILLLIVGYCFYFFFSSYKRLEITPLFTWTCFIFVYEMICFLLGLMNGYTFSQVFSSFSVKAYVLMIVPLFSFRHNRFVNRRSFFTFFNLTCTLLSLLISSFFLYFEFSNYSVGQRLSFLDSILLPNFGLWSVYSTGGLFFTSLLYVLVNSIVLECLLFFDNNSHKIFLSLCFLINSFAILQSGSRGMLVCLVLSLFFVYLLSLYKAFSLSTKKNLSIPFLIVFGLVLVFASVAIVSKTNLLERFINIISDEGIQYRLVFIKKSIGKVFSFPLLLGKGFGACFDLATSGHLEIDFLEILVDEGFIGLLLWMYPVLFIFQNAKKCRNNDYCTSIIAPLVIVSIVLLSFSNPYYSDFFGFSIISVLSMSVYKEDFGTSILFKKKKVSFSIPLFWI